MKSKKSIFISFIVISSLILSLIILNIVFSGWILTNQTLITTNYIEEPTINDDLDLKTILTTKTSTFDGDIKAEK